MEDRFGYDGNNLVDQSELYADIIIDISTKQVDRVFQYQIPLHLRESVGQKLTLFCLEVELK